MLIEWYKVLKGIKEPEEARRAGICAECPHRTRAKFLDIVGGDIQEVKGHYCKLCGCPLVAKIKTRDEDHICERWT